MLSHTLFRFLCRCLNSPNSKLVFAALQTLTNLAQHGPVMRRFLVEQQVASIVVSQVQQTLLNLPIPSFGHHSTITATSTAAGTAADSDVGLNSRSRSAEDVELQAMLLPLSYLCKIASDADDYAEETEPPTKMTTTTMTTTRSASLAATAQENSIAPGKGDDAGNEEEDDEDTDVVAAEAGDIVGALPSATLALPTSSSQDARNRGDTTSSPWIYKASASALSLFVDVVANDVYPVSNYVKDTVISGIGYLSADPYCLTVLLKVPGIVATCLRVSHRIQVNPSPASSFPHSSPSPVISPSSSAPSSQLVDPRSPSDGMLGAVTLALRAASVGPRSALATMKQCHVELAHVARMLVSSATVTSDGDATKREDENSGANEDDSAGDADDADDGDDKGEAGKDGNDRNTVQSPFSFQRLEYVKTLLFIVQSLCMNGQAGHLLEGKIFWLLCRFAENTVQEIQSLQGAADIFPVLAGTFELALRNVDSTVFMEHLLLDCRMAETLITMLGFYNPDRMNIARRRGGGRNNKGCEQKEDEDDEDDEEDEEEETNQSNDTGAEADEAFQDVLLICSILSVCLEECWAQTSIAAATSASPSSSPSTLSTSTSTTARASPEHGDKDKAVRDMDVSRGRQLGESARLEAYYPSLHQQVTLLVEKTLSRIDSPIATECVNMLVASMSPKHTETNQRLML